MFVKNKNQIEKKLLEKIFLFLFLTKAGKYILNIPRQKAFDS